MSEKKVVRGSPVIEARGLVKVYGQSRALDGIDLTVWPADGPVAWTLIAAAAVTLVSAPLTLYLYGKQR
jgi:hypothetical protein